MRIRLLVLVAFAALGATAVIRHLDASAALDPRGDVAPEEPGSFPASWIAGVDCPNEPRIQVHEYNRNFYILRQSKCDTFEAPFMYLIFGDEKALLMDTGSAVGSPVADTVQSIIDRWLRFHERDSIPLIVAHTHSHFDHILGDAQFREMPGVEQVVGLTLSDVTSFWGFENYPEEIVTVDLGNRKIQVIGTPGHQAASVTLYDRRTQLLLTGDIVYPGHLFVFSPSGWHEFVASLQRLEAFVAANPVRAVVGCHIEMGSEPGASYAYGTQVHPNEHTLEFPPSIIGEILKAATAMGDSPECAIFDEFVIHPVYKCGITWNG